ncbi:MAG TPA: hypothetical protein VHE30_26670 [Polyangiaceae bacterium]|nr:hypothetical protein [Polyangiaceae bacterium]
MSRLRVPHGALGFLAVAMLAGCSSSSSADAAASGGPTGAPSSSAEPDPGATSLSFSTAELVLLPGQTEKLSFTVAPTGRYTVNLALVGDAADAYLDVSQVETEESGIGWFSLTAPTSPSAFSVRAAVGKAFAELAVSEGKSSTTLEVVPTYSGHRTVTEWTATVNAGRSCDPTLVPPPDGALAATAPKRPRVPGVPLGTPLTITVRAGHFAGGCVEVEGVVAGGADSVTQVSVPVTDRPLQTTGASVPVRLGIDTGMPWVDAYTTLNQSMQAAFSPSVAGDATSLLDAMHDATPDTAQATFTVERTLHAWDEKLVRSLGGDLGGRGLRTTVGRWLDAVLPTLTDRAIVGHLDVASSGVASFSVGSTGGLAPADVGFPAALTDVSFSASSDDQLVFGGSTGAFPIARLAGALALGPARTDEPGADSVAAALAALVDCKTVGTTLAGSSGAAYGGCTASCVERRCTEALAAMWNRALAVDATASLDVSASGSVAAVTDDATPSAVDGTWVGTLTLGKTDVKVGGLADSSVPTAAAP